MEVGNLTEELNAGYISLAMREAAAGTAAWPCKLLSRDESCSAQKISLLERGKERCNGASSFSMTRHQIPYSSSHIHGDPIDEHENPRSYRASVAARLD